VSLCWHPRAAHAPQRGTAVDFGEPSPPIFVDEAEVLLEEVEGHFADSVVAAETEGELDELVDETFGIPRAARLPLPARSGPRLDPEATARVSRRLQAEREELVALRRAGLIDNEEETR